MRKFIVTLVFTALPICYRLSVLLSTLVSYTQKDFDHLYEIVQKKTYPAYGSYLLLKDYPGASADYQMKGPF